MARRSTPAALGLGPLETELMRVLWRRRPSRAAEVAVAVNRRRAVPLAYTTVLNVLLNLEKKGVVDHTVEGRAFRFAPVLTEAELLERQARRRARELLELYAEVALTAFVSEVRSDPALAELLRQLWDEVGRRAAS